jgi:hypothetical protein
MMSREYTNARQIGDVRSLLRTIRYAVGTILLTGLIFVVFGVLLIEAMSIVLTRTLPTIYVHLVAAAIGLLLGYAAAVTVALREVVRGVMGTLERIVTEIEHAGTQLAHSVETFSSAASSNYSDTPHPTHSDSPSYRSSPRVNDLATMMIRPVEHVVQ